MYKGRQAVVLAGVCVWLLSCGSLMLHAQNVIDDRGWGEKYDDTYGYANSDSDYWARSGLYPLGSERYNFGNPKMYLIRNEGGYMLVVRFLFQEKPWSMGISFGPSMRLATTEGDTIGLDFQLMDKFVLRQRLDNVGNGSLGSRWRQLGYCVECYYFIPDIDVFLSRTYVGFNIGGYYNQDYSDDAKRTKSLNRNLRTAKKGVDRRAQTVMKRRYLSTRPE